MATHRRTPPKQHGLASLMPLEEQSRESEMDGLDIELCELLREFGPTWPNEKLVESMGGAKKLRVF